MNAVPRSIGCCFGCYFDCYFGRYLDCYADFSSPHSCIAPGVPRRWPRAMAAR